MTLKSEYRSIIVARMTADNRTIVQVPYSKVANAVWDSAGRASEIKPEILEWLREQGIDVRQDSLCWTASIDEVYMGFRDANEALMFKLRWGGS